MRPVSVFANGPGSEIEQLQADLHGRWRQATRAVMVLLSAHGLPPAQIAELLDCHPATVRRWISRFNAEGMAGLADRPRSGRPRLGGRRLTGRIAALLARPGPWTLPRIWRYLGGPQVSMRTLYRRVRLVAIWRRPKLTARGDPAHDHVVAGIVARLLDLPRRAVVLAEDETHLNLLPRVRASWTLRTVRPQVPTPGTNRQVTVFGALEVSTGAWVYRWATAAPPTSSRCWTRCSGRSRRLRRSWSSATTTASITPARSRPTWRSTPGWSFCTEPGTARTTTRSNVSGPG